MGRVFTVEQIQKKMVPWVPDSFILVNAMLHGAITNCPFIDGAMKFGSVAEGRENIRSDYDCLVLYQSDKRVEVFKLLQDVTRSAEEYFVQIDVIVLETRLAQRGLHSLNGSLLLHLKQKGVVIGKNPLEFIHCDFQRMQRDTFDYMTRKINRLEKTWVSLHSLDTCAKHQFYRKLLEVSMHVARKIAFLGEMPDDLSRDGIVRAYAKLVNNEELSKALLLCLSFDDRYTQTVADNLRQYNAASYSNALGAIEKNFATIMSFLRKNLIWLCASHH